MLLTGASPVASIVADTCGCHDTIGGACSQESNVVRYGAHARHMHACRQTFLAHAPAWGLRERDLAFDPTPLRLLVWDPPQSDAVADERRRADARDAKIAGGPAQVE